LLARNKWRARLYFTEHDREKMLANEVALAVYIGVSRHGVQPLEFSESSQLKM
jgi:hypothetical protein